MGDDVEAVSSFAERMKDRVRDLVAENLSDDELMGFVNQVMHDAFMSERVEHHRYGGGHTTHRALLPELVKELLEERMRVAVGAWIVSHEAEVRMLVEKVITEGAGAALMQALSSAFQQDLTYWGESLTSRLGLRPM